MFRTFTTLALLLTLCVMSAFAAAPRIWKVDFINNAGKHYTWPVYGRRVCSCIKNIQTAKIWNWNGGNVKIFSNEDCTGNYVTIGAGKTQNNAQWVNSISIGESGIASEGPSGCFTP
ncbi:hypothetical protein BG004_004476 [Podila humilis]|nr:hypothetical protein BG004_004476 [Podila humilis]